MNNETGMLVLCVMMIALMLAAGHEKIRKSLLANKYVAQLETKIGVLERFYWAAFALCMIVGIAVRCYRFCELPSGLNQDEAMAGLEAFNLLHTGKDQHGISWPTYFEAWTTSQMSTLYSYCMIPFVYIFGDLNRFVLRLPALLLNIAMLPVVWDLARRILGKNYALLALMIAVVNPWQIMEGRWALEANMMPHVYLLGVYLLCIGRKNRAALYASMAVFALTPYAYGLAAFSTPAILVPMACYYLARKKVTVPDIVICIAIFLAVAWPYYYTLAINAFDLETLKLGPFTLPRFEESVRENDLVFGREYPYVSMVENLFNHFDTYLMNRSGGLYNSVIWIGPMYTFMTPVFAYAFYRLWRDRRGLAYRRVESDLRDGGFLILAWMGAALFNGVMIGGVINRNNVVYYPLMLLCAYGLYWMGKKLKTALIAALLIVGVGFSCFVSAYYTDEAYQQGVANSFRDGLYDALTDTWDWDYDRYYVTTAPEVYVMFAHRIDCERVSEEKELLNSNGETTGWYYTERYSYVDFSEFEPDPMECAVYIVRQDEKVYFNEADFIMTDYNGYAAAYPRYWAE